MHKTIKLLNKFKSYILLILIILLALKVFVPQLGELKESIVALKSANKSWVLFGLIIYWLGLPVLAWQYMVIAKKALHFWLTFKVQVAGLFVSKLLPSSLGTLTLNTYYLTVKKHTMPEATSVMAINAVTSGIAYAILILIALLLSPNSISGIVSELNIHWTAVVLIVFGLLLFIVLLLKLPKTRALINKYTSGFIKNIKDYKNNKKGVLLAILLNAVGSSTSLLALYASAQAVGIDITLPQAFMAYTFGNIAAGLVPTPGGLGAAEAGLYGAFVLMGYDTGPALSAVLIYRLISFWIPAIPGYIAFWNLRKDVLAKFSLKAKSST